MLLSRSFIERYEIGLPVLVPVIVCILLIFPPVANNLTLSFGSIFDFNHLSISSMVGLSNLLFKSLLCIKLQVLNENLATLTAQFEQATAAKLKCQQEAEATQLTISLANR